MFGDDPTADVESEHRAVSLTHKPVVNDRDCARGSAHELLPRHRSLRGVALIGEPALAPKLGDVDAKSAAYSLASARRYDQRSGFKAGQILDEFQKIIESHGDAVVPVTVTRASGEEKNFSVTPKQSVNKNS